MSKKVIHPRMITKSMKPFGTEPRAGDEYFANGIFEFNITMMNAYIDSHPEEFQKAEIAPDRLYHGYPTIDQDFYSRGYNLIDGHHRLHKAHQLGHEEIIWAWILSMEQHCRFMFKGFEKYMEYWNDKLGIK